MLDIIDWAPSVTGQIVKAPMGNGGECVDLAVLWCQANKLPRVWANAIGWWDQYDPHYWGRIINGPLNAPPPGALVIWREDPVLDVGGAGHIAICVGATPYRLLTLDQNWPEKSNVHYQEHDYRGVAGWLYPLPQPPLRPRSAR